MNMQGPPSAALRKSNVLWFCIATWGLAALDPADFEETPERGRMYVLGAEDKVELGEKKKFPMCTLATFRPMGVSRPGEEIPPQE
ncbi:rCG51340 [Rattus norvegicus]|uniref:RCG51340 n=1 Tax=Rattus norvegicus TaxID=10116 RepID=A6IYX3_RAT|nr:rCG51340 [Rattus norvegicus]